jgi:hypothetical protein
MRSRILGLILASASLLAAASPASAIICYIVYNRGESVIYQNTYPPVDMSSAGEPAREAMQRRGEHLTFGDINECPTLTYLTGTGGIDDMGVDAVLSNLPGSGGLTPKMGIMGGKAPSPAAAPAAAAPAASTSSKGTKSSY